MDDFDFEDEPLDALEWMIQTNNPGLHDALVEALDHWDWDVRIFAGLKLVDLFRDTEAIPVLAEALTGGDRTVRRAAADALWELGDSEAPQLLRALYHSDSHRRDAASDALDRIGWVPDDIETEVAYYITTRQWHALVLMGSDAVSGLLSALYDSDGTIRRGAAWALGEVADPVAVEGLSRLLNDTAGDLLGVGARVCDIAAEALGKIGTPTAFAALDQFDEFSADEDEAY